MDFNPQYYRRKRPWLSLIAIAGSWSALATVIWLSIVSKNIFAYLLCTWIIGLLQFGLCESVTHEAAHGNLFHSKKLHLALQWLYCYPFFRTLGQYKVEHFNHHKYLNQPQDHLAADYAFIGLTSAKPNLFFIWFIKPVTGFPAWLYCRNFNFPALTKKEAGFYVYWAAMVLIICYVHLAFYFILYWLIPFFWCSNSFLYWSEIRDHFNTQSGTRSNTGFWYNLFTYNNGYHFTHHQYPYIPWHNLRKAHKALPGGQKGDITKGFFQTYYQLKKTI